MKQKPVHELKNILETCGWHEGRDISAGFANALMLKIYPNSVLNVFAEFGDLSFVKDVTTPMHTRHFEIRIEFKSSMLNNQELFEYYSIIGNVETPEFKIEPQRYYDGDLEYYFSVLLGTQLYTLSGYIDHGDNLLIDKNQNVYLLDDIGNLSWIAPDIMTGLNRLLVGIDYYIPFHENTVEWVFNKDETPAFIPPINKNLNGINPFFTKK